MSYMSEQAIEQQNLSGLQTEEEEWLNDPVAQAEYKDWLDSIEVKRLASPIDANLN